MPWSCRLLALLSASSNRSASHQLTPRWTAPVAGLALVAFITSTSAATSAAQGSGAAGTPLHLAVDRFDFVASGDTQPLAKALRVHNGSSTRFTDVRLTRLVYASPARGAMWLVALPRQSAVAPDELATVGTLCIDATGLPAGTYRATAAVSAHEVQEPVALTVTLVVTDAGARARHSVARCRTAATK
ncbi:MAG TPA: hypothetical protein VE869_17935 [Gemmatimonas sp.]|nr:hypothetical protein [Gemmatimonas sp.]